MKKVIVMLSVFGLLTVSGCSDVKITPKDKHLFLSYLDSVQKVAIWQHSLHNKSGIQHFDDVLLGLTNAEKEKVKLWKMVKQTKSLKYVAKKQRKREKDVFSGKIDLLEYYEPYWELADFNIEKKQKEGK